MAAQPWQGFLLQPYTDAAGLTSDGAIDSYLQQFATTIKHPVGTAIVSKWTDTGGVVGPDLTVKNTNGLRVVDASVIVRLHSLLQEFT
jgi:choline dehydrogenase-like flavoprotein